MSIREDRERVVLDVLDVIGWATPYAVTVAARSRRSGPQSGPWPPGAMRDVLEGLAAQGRVERRENGPADIVFRVP